MKNLASCWMFAGRGKVDKENAGASDFAYSHARLPLHSHFAPKEKSIQMRASATVPRSAKIRHVRIKWFKFVAQAVNLGMGQNSRANPT